MVDRMLLSRCSKLEGDVVAAEPVERLGMYEETVDALSGAASLGTGHARTLDGGMYAA